jgi:tetratricopeptide (TPR) repeat protein
MRRAYRARGWLLLIAWSLLLALAGAADPAAAREPVLGISERVFKAIDESQDRMDEDDVAGALQALEGLQDRYLSDYEKTQVLRMRGVILYHAERYDDARLAFETALEQDDVPEPLIADLLGILGRLALMTDNNLIAEERFQALLAIPNQDTPENRVLLASAYLRQGKYADALTPLASAIREQREAGQSPREDWLSMLAAVHYELEDYEAMRAVVRELVERYPSERYLMNLAALHGQLGDEERQLALIEALNDDGRLDAATEVRLLASLFLAQELPYKAAVLLQSAIDGGLIDANRQTLEQLSQAWYLAQEVDRAIPPLERAAEQAGDGELYMRLAGLHMDAYRWEAAAQSAARALERGGLTDEGRAWLTMGMARVRLDHLKEAARCFRQARAFEATQGYADQWLAYVANEERLKEPIH